MNNNDAALDFIMETNWARLPGDVQHQANRCLLDTLGALLAGRQTPVAVLTPRGPSSSMLPRVMRGLPETGSRAAM